jgi:hypothetical protein
MAGRKIEGEAEARRCLAAVESSTLSLADWARTQGIDGRSLNMWRVIFARHGIARPAPRLVELVPSAPRAASIVVRCGAFRVEVDEDFDQDVLHRVLQVLAAC